MNTPVCPKCSMNARATQTRYGVRHECCGLHSWDGKPLVSKEVHAARNRCHAAFDPLWQDAPRFYEITEAPGSKERAAAKKRIRKSARNRAYHYIAHVTGLSEPDCHMAGQADLEKLAQIEVAALAASPEIIRNWWKSQLEQAA